MNFKKPGPEEVPDESRPHRKALGELAQDINYPRGFKGGRKWGRTQRTGAHKTSLTKDGYNKPRCLYSSKTSTANLETCFRKGKF